MTLYHTLHSSVHVKNNHLRMQFRVRRDSVSLAWVTPGFEIYCVAAGVGSSPTSTSTSTIDNNDNDTHYSGILPSSNSGHQPAADAASLASMSVGGSASHQPPNAAIKDIHEATTEIITSGDNEEEMDTRNDTRMAPAEEGLMNTTEIQQQQQQHQQEEEGCNTNEEIKTDLAHAAQKICKWITREEQKLFILGGAVRLCSFFQSSCFAYLILFEAFFSP